MLLEHQRDVMLRDLAGDFGTIHERRARLRAMEAGWARRQEDHPGAPTDPTDQSFEAQALRWLQVHRAMLIGEVVPIAFEYLRTNPASDDRSRFAHVIVDEYQDLNPLEQELIELLVSPESSVCVAGDDDQSIYRFRFAHPEGIVLFLEDSRTDDMVINDCRRCPDNVVDLANDLISRAPHRRKPPMTPAAGRDGQVSILQWQDLDAEVEGIVSIIAGDVADERSEPGDYLVLVNRRRVGYRLRTSLVAQGVDAHSFFQDNALKESKPAQQAFTLLTLLAAPDDKVARRVWLGFGDQDARADAYRGLRVMAAEEGVDPFDLLDAAVTGRRLPWRAIVERWRTALARLEALAPLSVPEVVDALFPPSDADLDLLRELANLVMPAVMDVRDLYAQMLRAITQPEVPQRPDYVRVMSLHKSKGLTSPIVIVAFAVAGAIPTLPAKASEDEIEAGVEEGRRLFYVAITRAYSELLISYPQRLKVADAKGMGVPVRSIRRRHADFWGETLPTPYLRELGGRQPVPTRGEVWLERRTASTG